MHIDLHELKVNVAFTLRRCISKAIFPIDAELVIDGISLVRQIDTS